MHELSKIVKIMQCHKQFPFNIDRVFKFQMESNQYAVIVKFFKHKFVMNFLI